MVNKRHNYLVTIANTYIYTQYIHVTCILDGSLRLPHSLVPVLVLCDIYHMSTTSRSYLVNILLDGNLWQRMTRTGRICLKVVGADGDLFMVSTSALINWIHMW